MEQEQLYEVEVTRTVIDSKTIEVEATSKEEAEANALHSDLEFDPFETNEGVISARVVDEGEPIGAEAMIAFSGCDCEVQTIGFGSYDEETDTNTGELDDQYVFFWCDDEAQLKDMMEHNEGGDFTIYGYRLIYL